MNTIQELNKKYGKVYVYLENEEIGNQFMKHAENEGYIFGDGKKPTERHFANVIAVNDDMTIHYVGANGRIAFQCNAAGVKRIDYGKFISGTENFFYEN